MGGNALCGTATGRSAASRPRSALDVQRPKVRDRATKVVAGERLRCTSNILPNWARRSRSLDALLPVLYLLGISTGNL